MIEPRLKCDILGRYETTAKSVRKVRIVVQLKQDPKDDESWSTCHVTALKDMCPDAIKRAIKFADRAASPPNIAATRAGEAKAAGDAEIEPGIAS